MTVHHSSIISILRLSSLHTLTHPLFLFLTLPSQMRRILMFLLAHIYLKILLWCRMSIPRNWIGSGSSSIRTIWFWWCCFLLLLTIRSCLHSLTLLIFVFIRILVRSPISFIYCYLPCGTVHCALFLSYTITIRDRTCRSQTSRLGCTPPHLLFDQLELHHYCNLFHSPMAMINFNNYKIYSIFSQRTQILYVAYHLFHHDDEDQILTLYTNKHMQVLTVFV